MQTTPTIARLTARAWVGRNRSSSNTHAKITVTPHLSGPTPLEPAAVQIAALLLQLEAGARAEELPGYVDRTRGY